MSRISGKRDTTGSIVRVVRATIHPFLINVAYNPNSRKIFVLIDSENRSRRLVSTFFLSFVFIVLFSRNSCYLQPTTTADTLTLNPACGLYLFSDIPSVVLYTHTHTHNTVLFSTRKGPLR